MSPCLCLVIRLIIPTSPFAGGLLSRPHDRWPELFSNSFWKEYPYFLPCAATSTYAMASLIVASVFLKEVGRQSTCRLSFTHGTSRRYLGLRHHGETRRASRIRIMLQTRGAILSTPISFPREMFKEPHTARFSPSRCFSRYPSTPSMHIWKSPTLHLCHWCTRHLSNSEDLAWIRCTWPPASRH